MVIISTKINKTNKYLPPKNKKTIKYIERNPLTEDIHTYVAGFNRLMGSQPTLDKYKATQCCRHVDSGDSKHCSRQ
jgi:hypothetical protein